MREGETEEGGWVRAMIDNLRQGGVRSGYGRKMGTRGHTGQVRGQGWGKVGG